VWLGQFGVDGLMKGELVGRVHEMVWRGWQSAGDDVEWMEECRRW
jgi:hypothetical protein